MNVLEPTPESFGFRPADCNTAIFVAAERVFLSSLTDESDAPEPLYKRDQVLENPDAFYFPVGWIGCSGHLVSKSQLRLISFGSYIGPGAHIWAYYQGISMGPLGKNRQNNLRILKVSDIEKTVGVLKQFLSPRWVDSHLVPRFASLPVDIEKVDLYFGIGGLLEAKMGNWFDFEVST